MLHWLDEFTGTRYQLSNKAEQAVRRHLAGELVRRLHTAVNGKAAADRAARFWSRDYYHLLFPLRFGRREPNGRLEGVTLPLDYSGAPILRTRSLDGDRLPPILPAEDESGELLAERILARTILANLLLRHRGCPPESLHAVRLALLLEPLAPELREARRDVPDTAARTIGWLRGEAGVTLPPGVPDDLLRAIHALRGLPAEPSLYLVLGHVQRIKKYVFETPGLSEIRGASALLDAVTERLRDQVADELGPEVVLRAAGSALEFLASGPRDAHGHPWEERICRAFGDATGAALITAAGVPLCPGDLVDGMQAAVGEAHRRLEECRDATVGGTGGALPFEARCTLCAVRAAEGWLRGPEGVAKPVCRVCVTRREAGLQTRGRQRECRPVSLSARRLQVLSGPGIPRSEG